MASACDLRLRRAARLRVANGIGGLALGVLTLAAAYPARAQGIGAPGLGGIGAPPSFGREQLERSEKRGAPPPAALPGAAPGQEAIAPPTNVPAMMSPNDELFDAINRGDIAAVRDALSRGADLNARNELDQTPLDLSVDLGRNAISFLLLSMRSGSSAPTTESAFQNQPQAPTKEARAAKTRASGPRGVHEVSLSARATGGQPSLPQLFAGNGGKPIPRAGFLGFDSR
jgi:hypothetical protein